jgi:hypothetical protein
MALRTGVSEKILSLRLGEPQQFELRLDGSNGANVSRTLRARPPLGRFDFRLSQLRDDVAATLAASLDLYLHIHGAAPIRLLSIAEPPDSAIGSVKLVEADLGSTKQLELEIAEVLTSTNLDVYVSNLDEPWRPVNVCKLASHPGENSHVLEFPEIIVPGSHEVVLKSGYGGTERIVGKTSCDLGTPSEADAYHRSLGFTGLDQVVRVVRLGQKPGQVSADDYRNGVSAVGRSLLDASLDPRSSRYQAMREYLLTEGNHGPLLEWLSQVLSEFATRAAGEAMLLRMYPHFADTMAGVAAQITDDLLATVWNASPLLGVVVDSRPGTETSQPSDSLREYWLGKLADFPTVFAATIDSEGSLIESGSNNIRGHLEVLGDSFLRTALREVHTNNSGEQREAVLRLVEFDRQSRDCHSGNIDHRKAWPLTMDLSANPNSNHLKEPMKRLARYVNNLHALAYTMCDVRQSLERAERAASLLVGEYSRSRLMIHVAVSKAVTRPT